jgi:hypothetical protein
VTTWANGLGSALFLPPDPGIGPSLTAVSIWVNGQSYQQQAIDEFLRIADYWLVAHAHTLGWTVVTEETSEPNRQNKVNVPDACAGVGVISMNIFQMLAAEGVRLVLDN